MTIERPGNSPGRPAAGSITVVSGGVGAARLLRGLIDVVGAAELAAVVNTGDDTVMPGRAISPDLDTITYTLADAIDPERGWGLRDETWQAMAALARYTPVRPDASAAATTWFNLGDRDLATHLYRTARLAEGARLTDVTAEITAAWQLDATLLPMSDEPVRTIVTTALGELSFQEYFVRERHDVSATAIDVRHGGASLTPEAAAALRADVVVVAPSNPLVSIAPIRALAGVDDALRARRDTVVAVSPLVGGRALKGPAERLMRELGHRPDSVGVAAIYAPIAGTLLIDEVDRGLEDEVRAAGMDCVVCDTIMATPQRAAALARRCLAAAGSGDPSR